MTETIIEVAQFDTQLLKNPDIIGTEYQQGEQLGFWNTREYVLFRDGHTCQHCHGKSKDKILNVHHIESRKTGGDSPNNRDVADAADKTTQPSSYKANTPKGGVRKKNQAPYLVKGFRLFDKVKYDGIDCFIFGRRTLGSFDIRLFDGTKVNAGVSYKKLRFLSISNSFIVNQIKRLAAIPPTNEFVGFLAEFL